MGKIPIIVKSKYCITNKVLDNECKCDVGGYAIINGNEKVIIAQEKIAPNIIQVFKNSKQNTKQSNAKTFQNMQQTNIFQISAITHIRLMRFSPRALILNRPIAESWYKSSRQGRIFSYTSKKR